MYAELDPRHDMQPHLPRILNREVYFKGQTIIAQGSDGFHAYYIEKGYVEIAVSEDTHEVRIAVLGPGEIFGEMALIEQKERSATVRALADTTVAIIRASDLEQKLKKIDDKAISALMRVFMDRLRYANQSQLALYRDFAQFQDHITGLVEKTGRGIDENHRTDFRDKAEPLLSQLEDLLERYRKI